MLLNTPTHLVILAEPHEARYQFRKLDYVLDHCRQLLSAVQPQLLLAQVLVVHDPLHILVDK